MDAATSSSSSSAFVDAPSAMKDGQHNCDAAMEGVSPIPLFGRTLTQVLQHIGYPFGDGEGYPDLHVLVSILEQQLQIHDIPAFMVHWFAARRTLQRSLNLADEPMSRLRHELSTQLLSQQGLLPCTQAKRPFHLTTGCPIIDRFLGGGIRTQMITELTGIATSGKSHLCLQTCFHLIWHGLMHNNNSKNSKDRKDERVAPVAVAAAESVPPPLLESTGFIDPGPPPADVGTAVYICVEHFNTKRMFDVAARMCAKHNNNDSSRHGSLTASSSSSLAPRDFLDRLQLRPITSRGENSVSMEDFEHSLRALPAVIEHTVPRVGLVVIDSISLPFRTSEEFGSGGGLAARKAERMFHCAAQLRRLAHEYNVAVLVTNQVVADFTPNNAVSTTSMPPPPPPPPQTMLVRARSPTQPLSPALAGSSCAGLSSTQTCSGEDAAFPLSQRRRLSSPKPSSSLQSFYDLGHHQPPPCLYAPDFSTNGRNATGASESATDAVPGWARLPNEEHKDRSVLPALGLAWSNCIHVRILLTRPSRQGVLTGWRRLSSSSSLPSSTQPRPPTTTTSQSNPIVEEDQIRIMNVVFSPYRPSAAEESSSSSSGCEYTIDAEGVRGIAPFC